jgi:hypothetical protein
LLFAGPNPTLWAIVLEFPMTISPQPILTPRKNQAAQAPSIMSPNPPNLPGITKLGPTGIKRRRASDGAIPAEEVVTSKPKRVRTGQSISFHPISKFKDK